MTATLPRTHVQMSSEPGPKRAVITHRWHQYRRLMGAVAAVLGLFVGMVLLWPAMFLIAALGAGIAIDATLALRNARSGTIPTMVADILFTGTALVVAGVPGAGVGTAVAYFILLVAVLGESFREWIVGLLAIGVGFVASIVPHMIGLHEQPVERSMAAGIVTVAVFGIATVGIIREFIKVNQIWNRSFDRQVEVADAISTASRALVAQDDVAATGRALDVIRDAMRTSVVFVERNIEDPTHGLCAVVDERSVDQHHAHPSFDRSAMMPWSVMPGARSHLEGGAPFFYRVEEVRGTPYDRGGDFGIQAEVDVPIIVSGSWVGVIGAADDDPERTWRTDDLILLRTLADLTGALWEREEGSRVRESLIGNLDGRLRYEEALTKASRALLGEQSVDVSPALRAIGMAANVDEICITETVPVEQGTPGARIAAVWTVQGTSPTYDLDDIVSYDRIPEIRHAIQNNEVAFYDGKLSKWMIVAINVGGAWYGTVSFARNGVDSSWSDRDIAACQTIADMLGAFFERSQNRARLEHSLSSKDQLIASVSHELRSPLTAVVGLADELITAGDSIGAEERDQLMEIILESSKEMADLVEDLLVSARSEDGTLPVFPERIDLSLLAQSVLSQMVVPAQSNVTVDDEGCVALADPVRVRQIIRNLFTNAFRYGASPITVSVGRHDGYAFLDVHDVGLGIPDEDRERIFEPYERSDSSRIVKSSVGLGLALSRRLAELMDGSLTYIRGEGATFRLTVPLPPVHTQVTDGQADDGRPRTDDGPGVRGPTRPVS